MLKYILKSHILIEQFSAGKPLDQKMQFLLRTRSNQTLCHVRESCKKSLSTVSPMSWLFNVQYSTGH